MAVTPETCPYCEQALRQEALRPLWRAERDAKRKLAVAAEARAALLTGPLKAQLHEQRNALTACTQARAVEQAADAAVWQAIVADLQPTEEWAGIP